MKTLTGIIWLREKDTAAGFEVCTEFSEEGS